MERKEFEQILKRALELQSLQKKPQEEELNTEDLQSAANRLGIVPEILEAAIKETNKKYKKFHFSGTPEQVREAFLKHFLMNESGVGQHYVGLRIDHDTIKTSLNGAIRTYHPLLKEIDAFVEFSPAREGGTNVSWSGSSNLSGRTKLIFGGWPVLILIPMFFSIYMQGQNLLTMLPLAAIFFATSMLMLWGMQNNAMQLSNSLTSYFQNCQTLDEIETHKQMQTELQQLKDQNFANTASGNFENEQKIPSENLRQPNHLRE